MAWYNSSWQYRKKITISAAKVSASLTNFPVYVNLADLGANFFSNVRTDGGDIRITTSDGTTELPREVVSIDTANQLGELHFKADSLSNTADTDFYIYFGNAGATEPAPNSTYGKYNVWDSNFVAVWHNAKDDSTSNALNGTLIDNATIVTTGQIRHAVSLDGAGDRVNIPSSSLLNLTSAFTIEAWVKATATGTIREIVTRGTGNTSANRQYHLRLTAANKLQVGFYNAAGTASNVAGATVLSANTFYYTVGVKNGTSLLVYVNGAQDGSGTFSGTERSQTSATFSIGALYTIDEWFPGLIDELRVSNIARNAAWIQTTYNNQVSANTFYTIGSLETQGNTELDRLVTIVSVLAESDVFLGSDTDKLVTSVTLINETDQISMSDIDKLITSIILASETDQRNMTDTNKLVTVVSLIGESDIRFFDEANRLITLTTSLLTIDQHSMQDILKLISILSIWNKIDVTSYVSLNNLISIIGLLTRQDQLLQLGAGDFRRVDINFVSTFNKISPYN